MKGSPTRTLDILVALIRQDDGYAVERSTVSMFTRIVGHDSMSTLSAVNLHDAGPHESLSVISHVSLHRSQ